MRKTLASVLLAGMLAGGTAAVVTSASAGASTPSTTATATKPATKKAQAKHPYLRRAIRRAVVRISAKTIGVTQADLVSELKSGKSIADVANEHSVAPQTVESNLVKAGDAALEKAVENHRLTKARAEKIAARLPALAIKVVERHFK